MAMKTTLSIPRTISMAESVRRATSASVVRSWLTDRPSGARCFLQRASIPGRIGERDRANRGQRDAGLAVRVDVGAALRDVADRAEGVDQRVVDCVRGLVARLAGVEAADRRSVSARLEHRPIE